MNDHDLSTGKREMGGGLERYTFTLPSSFFKSVARAGKDVKQAIAGVYCISPRPDPREILNVQVKISGQRADVTLTIQRGHYMLLQLLKNHHSLHFNLEEGFATCDCHPDQRHPLVPNSFPDYREEF